MVGYPHVTYALVTLRVQHRKLSFAANLTRHATSIRRALGYDIQKQKSLQMREYQRLQNKNVWLFPNA